MTSESIGSVLGFIVGAIVLAAAFYYVPVGPRSMPAKVEAPVPAAPAAPAVRGPVVREVPN